MKKGITAESSCEEIAAKVSEALERAGILATLTGGSAVTIYTKNRYQSEDLDFVTAETMARVAPAMAEIGFSRIELSRLSQFEHPNCSWYVEFVSPPIAFGNRQIRAEEIPLTKTPFGLLRTISSTQSVMDRLSAYFAWKDLQCWDQAIDVASTNAIDWQDLKTWFESEGQSESEFERFRQISNKN